MKFSNTPVVLLCLMPGREWKDAEVTVITEMSNQLWRGSVSGTVNLRDAFLNALCVYFLKGQVSPRTRSVRESCW